MIEIKRILCPVDFSDFSRAALKQALAFARWYDAEVTAFHAFEIPLPPMIPTASSWPFAAEPMSRDPPAISEAMVSELRRFADSVQPSGGSLRIEVEACDTVQGILAKAQSLPADLLVMGTHGRGGLDRLLLGSVAEKVLRKARCPVLTVPPQGAGAPADIPDLFERILCPVDFSESSLKALTYALSIAQEADARLLLMHVVEALPLRDDEMLDHFELSRYRDEMIKEARARLQQMVPEEARTWCKPEDLVSTGKAYREILRVALERQAHVIVMGVHGRNPFDVMLFGSTTQHVVRGATCPVLSLRG
jgi:nucleotide-binding universal stress UspA family protein